MLCATTLCAHPPGNSALLPAYAKYDQACWDRVLIVSPTLQQVILRAGRRGSPRSSLWWLPASRRALRTVSLIQISDSNYQSGTYAVRFLMTLQSSVNTIWNMNVHLLSHVLDWRRRNWAARTPPRLSALLSIALAMQDGACRTVRAQSMIAMGHLVLRSDTLTERPELRMWLAPWAWWVPALLEKIEQTPSFAPV